MGDLHIPLNIILNIKFPLNHLGLPLENESLGVQWMVLLDFLGINAIDGGWHHMDLIGFLDWVQLEKESEGGANTDFRFNLDIAFELLSYLL